MLHARQFKGISPLVATIMLIAFTLVVAGIVASWATQFATTQRQNIQFCTDARVLLYSGSFAPDAVNPNVGTLNLAVFNNGQVPLEFLVLLSYENDTVMRYPTTVNTTAGEFKTVVLAGIGSNLREVTIQSQRCTGAQDLLRAIDIRGLGA